MREIKFRALIRLSGIFCYWRITEQVPPIVLAAINADWHVSIHQYTGLKDKNGKEIYEGDIVSAFDNAAMDSMWGLDKIHTGVIEYVGNCFSLKVSGVYLDQWLNAENFEVIGNIYETPHLLNSDKNVDEM